MGTGKKFENKRSYGSKLFFQKILLFLLFENKAGGLLYNMIRRYGLHSIFGKFKYTCSLPLCN